jgi:hypothetical protein
MKFVEKCFLLQDNIFRTRDEELCAAISFQSIQKHLYEGHIHFSFLIKKNCNEPSIDIRKPAENVKMASVQVKSSTVPFTRTNKGVSQSIPTAAVQQQQSSVSSANSQTLQTPTVTAIETTATKNQPPDYSSISSINRLNPDKPSISPAFAIDPFKRSNSNEEVTSSHSYIFLATQNLIVK